MKTMKYILLFTLIGLLQSCDWLELKPIDNYGINSYWQSKDQVDRFIRGLHYRVRSRQFTFFQMGECRGGTFESTRTASVFGETKTDLVILRNTLSVQNPGISTEWGDFYKDIMQINHAITEIPKTTFLGEEDKNYNMGILHGLRAYYYFHLFRTYGGVPIVETPEVLNSISSPSVLNKARSSEEETYNFIKAEITTSANYFSADKYTINTIDKASYWSKAATNVLKAEVLLWGAKVKPIGKPNVYSSDVAKDLNDAKNGLLDIISSTKYEYIDNFSDVFSSKNNKEIIFCVRYLLNEATNSFNKFLYPQAGNQAKGFENFDGSQKYGTPGVTSDPLNLASSGAISQYEYSWDLFTSYNDDDTRKKVTFFDLYQTDDRSISGALLVKFMGEMDKNIRKFTSDWPVYRYMDVLLLLAEIEGKLGGDAAKYINDVRKRAYGENFESHKFPKNGETVEDAILEERTKEFVAEGKRWYDIRRMKEGELAKSLQTSITDPTVIEQHLLWPITSSVMSKDPLVEQTTGY